MTQTKERAGWTKLHQRGQFHFVQGSWTLCGLAAARSDLELVNTIKEVTQKFQSGDGFCPKCQRATEKAQKGAK
ncbi:hypothetical protein [Deinococcus cellulosilyticus]|uniref:Uncharacterized protein n=1 Tax=Deinococcus cellulosilyticus (strain DSM 18568 / NBRC 106333 / KACC 11606 / 5516J-15) TaxID=1223518 RepID=A0A511MXE9_DEIC1|nr:hypothetical protein [Deinococcus cellulosilyticus]GEM44806.1 hypothetical protein DC3_04410 [Deinococcus cellulosilyticus NBRC 106333 = KACC 11606]